jgi:phage baseplate assembly protein W
MNYCLPSAYRFLCAGDDCRAAIWPDLQNQRVLISPPRNGIDRFTGKILQGWEHVEQSMEIIFSTPYHERVLRRWVGSFVPHILGESAVERIITRFFWAIITAIDLWEPDFRIKQIYFMGDNTPNSNPLPAGTTVNLLRQGDVSFRTEGVFYPRGHLGDFTPYERHAAGLVSHGGNLWDVVPLQ